MLRGRGNAESQRLCEKKIRRTPHSKEPLVALAHEPGETAILGEIEWFSRKGR
jgi:hypothetical protein